jgi:hypothetical protein
MAGIRDWAKSVIGSLVTNGRTGAQQRLAVDAAERARAEPNLSTAMIGARRVVIGARNGQVSYEVLGPVQGTGGQAADLPDVADPKIKGKGGVTTPTMFTLAKPSPTAQMVDNDRGTANLDLTTFRTTGTTKQTVQIFSKVNPELAAAVDAYIRLALTDSTVVAYDRTSGVVDSQGSAVIQQWIRQNDLIGQYDQGWNPNFTLRALCEMWALELRQFGSAAGEVVMDQARVPTRIQPVGTRDIKWFPAPNARWAIPNQQVGGQYVPLNFPAFFYVSLDQSLYTAYAESPMEPALQPVLFGLQLLNDIRRVIRMNLHPRTTVVLKTEELQGLVPPEAQQDPDKMLEFYNKFIAQVASTIDGLEPEEALVMLDSMEVKILDRGNSTLSNEYDVLTKMADQKISSGAKVLPGVIGRGANASSASVESMIFIKQVEGSVQKPLNDMLSRMFTLILRMLGSDSVVEFKLADIDLRPKVELEAFKAQRQARVMELLSLGFISDEEAAIQLNGQLPSGTFTPLSGSRFYEPTTVGVTATNPYSGDPAGGTPGQDGGGGSQNEQLANTPAKGKSGSNPKQAQKPAPAKTPQKA